MSVRTYNPAVRVANWCENLYLEDDILKDFIEKRERGELLIQKSGKLRDKVLNKVDLSVSRDGYLHFGDRVMILNPGAVDRTKHASGDEPRDDNVISINISPSALHSGSSIPAECGVSGSKNTEASARNVFVITSTTGQTTGTLAYREPFYLCTGDDDERLYLSSEALTFSKVSGKSRHNSVSLVPNPSFGTQFQVLHFNPKLRMEYEHTPVHANTKVIINHVQTNHNLAVEQKYKLRTPFGWEYEVSTHTYLDCHRAEMDVNHFMFVCSVPGDDIAPHVLNNN
ncbi:cilia- and flagella-associated protein 161-like [Tubulanus polymorphus]|uniref:cilia- and flagella-associated protein 161-like n=1 Tax=Tubulanus polymorphus TaxID=672921 RepID=UPI003DA54A27